MQGRGHDTAAHHPSAAPQPLHVLHPPVREREVAELRGAVDISRRAIAALSDHCKLLEHHVRVLDIASQNQAEEKQHLETRLRALEQARGGVVASNPAPLVRAEFVPDRSIQASGAGSEIRGGSDAATSKEGGDHAGAHIRDVEMEIDTAYALCGSMWDAALLIGTAPVGAAGSFFTLLLLGLNISVQILFQTIVFRSLTTPRYDETTVLELRAWRRSIGHSTVFADRAKEQSLVARVCNLDPGLEVAGSQASSHDQITAYLGDGVVGLGPGLLMCVLCLFTWGLTISKEVQSLFHFSRAIIALPHGAHTIVDVDADAASFRSVSTSRRVLVLLVQASRLGICTSLLVSGVCLHACMHACMYVLILNLDLSYIHAYVHRRCGWRTRQTCPTCCSTPWPSSLS